MWSPFQPGPPGAHGASLGSHQFSSASHVRVNNWKVKYSVIICERSSPPTTASPPSDDARSTRGGHSPNELELAPSIARHGGHSYGRIESAAFVTRIAQELASLRSASRAKASPPAICMIAFSFHHDPDHINQPRRKSRYSDPLELISVSSGGRHRPMADPTESSAMMLAFIQNAQHNVTTRIAMVSSRLRFLSEL